MKKLIKKNAVKKGSVKAYVSCSCQCSACLSAPKNDMKLCIREIDNA